MGGKPSSVASLHENELLKRFVDKKRVEQVDTFWEDLLSFQFTPPCTREDSKILEESIGSICEHLGNNNLSSGNFATLVTLFIDQAGDILADQTHINSESINQRCRNALLLLRCALKYFIENYQENDIVAQFSSTQPLTGVCTGRFEEFLSTLNRIIGDLPVTTSTHCLHLEAVNTLLILISFQLTESKPLVGSIILLSLMNGKCSKVAVKVVRRLFHNYIKNEELPLPADSTGLLSKTFSGLWSVFGTSEPKSVERAELHPLACQSLLLLIILANHCTQEFNGYREALFDCYCYEPNGRKDSEPDKEAFPLNFTRLYTCLCRDSNHDETILLLYNLMHKNKSFREFVLKREDIADLIIPILKLLYKAEEHNCHHIYMTLIVLLILTQEEEFNKRIHHIELHDVEWFKDKQIKNVSLGDLIILVVVRTIQFNMLKTRDRYLHTNCLATLANMAAYFDNLNSYSAQRIVTLLSKLSKKFLRLKSRESNDGVKQEQEQDDINDLPVVEDIVRMILEIINSCLFHVVKQNRNLVYALLYNKEIFTELTNHETFKAAAVNIELVLSYFDEHLNKHDQQSLGVETVMEVIDEGLSKWPSDHLKKLPDLKFKYVEEDSAEEFFVPYVWSLVYKSSILFWNTDKIMLFHMTTESVPSLK